MAVGVFDGVHVGHRDVIRILLEEARRRDLPSVVLTFDRHPRPQALGEEGGLLTSPHERVRILAGLGVEWIASLGFTDHVRSMEPERFFHEVLLAMVGARALIVGPTHRFGRGGGGDVDLLRRLGRATDVDVLVAPESKIDDAPVSSRRIRMLLLSGDVGKASRALGRPYRLDGIVVRGSGIGRDLGFPTANLQVDAGRLVPGDGVYGAVAHLPEGDSPAVVNVGVAPTVQGGTPRARRVEVHLIGRDVPLYGRQMGVSFVSRIREERRFCTIDELRRQIAIDVGRVRALFENLDQESGTTAGNCDPSPIR